MDFKDLKFKCNRKPIIVTGKENGKLYEIKHASVTMQGAEITSKVELHAVEYSNGEYHDHIRLDKLIEEYIIEEYAMKRILFLIDDLVKQNVSVK